MRAMTWRDLGLLAHIGVPGPAPFIAIGVFAAGMGAAFGAYKFDGTGQRARVGRIGLGMVALTCFLLATFFPLILGARPSLGRPSTTAHLLVLTPRPDEVFHGDPANIPVVLELTGGKVVPITSLRLVPNEGHIHLYLDGSLVAMTGLAVDISARPGRHALRAEFVAIDHGPFHPRVAANVTFDVTP